jgi:hypothetical protein
MGNWRMRDCPIVVALPKSLGHQGHRSWASVADDCAINSKYDSSRLPTRTAQIDDSKIAVEIWFHERQFGRAVVK